MPKVGQFIVIPESDAEFTLPDPGTGINDRHFLDIDAPNVDTQARGVVAFRVNPNGTEEVRLFVRLNSTNLLTVNFTSDPTRTWHEIIPRGALLPVGNELTVAVSGPGSIGVSDIVLFYQADIPG